MGLHAPCEHGRVSSVNLLVAMVDLRKGASAVSDRKFT